jgi:glycolate oxidase FAD binding subunit
MNTILPLEHAQPDPAVLEHFALDNLKPRAVVAPEHADELARVIAHAAQENLAIVPWGGGTLQHLGGIPRRYDLAIQTTRLNDILEYSPDDMTVTVEAGIPLGKLQMRLAEHNQFLPLDPPLAERATIGGVLAANASGALRLRYGAPRDFTLGMRVVNAAGKIVKSGSKVVKNVAGYEMPKLYIGSLGTLGIIIGATFKVWPKPSEQITLIARFANYDTACNAVRALWNLTIWPLALELLDARLARALGIAVEVNDFVVVARFGGTRAVIEAASSKAEHAVRTNNAQRVEITPEVSLWQRIADLPATLRDAHPLGATLRIALAPAQLNAAIEKITERAHAIGIEPPQFFAHAATAVIYLGFDASDAQIIESVKHLRWALAPLHAHVVVESAPRSVKEQVAVWGTPGAEHPMAQRIKAQFDPQMILNAGRFIGGL